MNKQIVSCWVCAILIDLGALGLKILLCRVCGTVTSATVYGGDN